MHPVQGRARGERASALWGTGNRGGEHRSSALWGTGNRGGEHRSKRVVATLAVSVLGFVLPLAATAGPSGGSSSGGAYIAAGVLQAAKSNPGGTIRVIIQSSDGLSGAKRANGGLGVLKAELDLIGAVAAVIPAAQINALQKIDGLVVTLDAPVHAANTSTQLWPHENGVAKLWGTPLSPAPKAPTIAIVDSGIDRNRADFDLGSRVVYRQVFTTLAQDPLKLDGRGHGTFVAGIAAGSAPGFAGAAPNANLVDLDVMDDRGMAMTSDVIKAAEWIYKNKDRYNIRVANFSLHSSSVLSIRYHPLNAAVQKLWFAGVVVVAASGNYGVAGAPSGVKHAPGNDPFVLTVGALDLAGTARIGDDSVAPWSAYGYTNEGFLKPEVVAAGRYMVGPVSLGASLRSARPANVVSSGYMQLSGTSFAAPVVSGLAAQILARNPGLTPDQVKGAIMRTARAVPQAPKLAQGRGQVNAVRAVAERSPLNPHTNLLPFVVSASGGSGQVLNAAAWADFALGSAAWSSAAWADAAWADAAWSSAAWSSAAWNDAAWNDAAWADTLAYEDNSTSDGASSDVTLSPEDILDLTADPDLK